MTYDNPVWIFVSKILQFTDVISIFFNYWLRKKIL